MNKRAWAAGLVAMVLSLVGLLLTGVGAANAQADSAGYQSSRPTIVVHATHNEDAGPVALPGVVFTLTRDGGEPIKLAPTGQDGVTVLVDAAAGHWVLRQLDEGATALRYSDMSFQFSGTEHQELYPKPKVDVPTPSPEPKGTQTGDQLFGQDSDLIGLGLASLLAATGVGAVFVARRRGEAGGAA